MNYHETCKFCNTNFTVKKGSLFYCSLECLLKDLAHVNPNFTKDEVDAINEQLAEDEDEAHVMFIYITEHYISFLLKYFEFAERRVKNDLQVTVSMFQELQIAMQLGLESLYEADTLGNNIYVKSYELKQATKDAKLFEEYNKTAKMCWYSAHELFEVLIEIDNKFDELINELSLEFKQELKSKGILDKDR